MRHLFHVRWGLVSCFTLLALGASILAHSMSSRTEDGTLEDQKNVRISRDISRLPLKSSCTVDPRRELFITDLTVVNDPCRTTWTGSCAGLPAPATQAAWTFGRLAEGLFGTTDPLVLSREVRAWLETWKIDGLVVNGDEVFERPNIQSLVLGPWDTASGGTGVLDMSKAPLRLLAIVSRLDLRQNSSYSQGTTAGEGRFVFGVLNRFGNPTEFLVILEYGLDAADCLDVADWAEAWHHLGTLPFGADYNAALQAVTDRFAAIGASPSKPNGSAINQVRTNEIALASPWELREFRLDGSAAGTAPLVTVTVAQTPANRHQRTALLANFATTNTKSILAGSHVVPLTWAGQSFRGGATRHSLDFNWDGPPPACTSILDNRVRHNLSLNTCNGCHGAEADTVFKHVEPRSASQEAQLSSFLTGNPFLSTDMCGGVHSFGDIERRRVDLCQLLVKSCSEIEAEPAVTFAH